MKGIVVDRKGRHAVVLTGDGSFIKINGKAHYKIGAEIEFEKSLQMDRSVLARISSIAAVFLFTLGFSYGVYSYTTPYSYVDFDINPSIELTVNVYDIIIKTETFNEDGEKLLHNNHLNFKKLNTGIAKLVDAAIQEGYLTSQPDSAILLSVDSKNEGKKQKLEKNIENAAAKALDVSKVKSGVISQQVAAQKRETAIDMGISPGKLTLIEKARKTNPELKLDDLKDDSVKEIMKQIKEAQDKKDDDKPKDSKSNEAGKKDNGNGKADNKENKENNDKNQNRNDVKQNIENEKNDSIGKENMEGNDNNIVNKDNTNVKENQDKENVDKGSQDKAKEDKEDNADKDKDMGYGNKPNRGGNRNKNT